MSENLCIGDDTVSRDAYSNMNFVHQILNFLESQGFDKTPKVIEANKNYEVVSFIKGDTFNSELFLSDEQIVSAVKLLKSIHDLLKGYQLFQSGLAVCHGDCGPHNFVFEKDTAVGLIDWEYAHLGSEFDDLVDFCWCVIDDRWQTQDISIIKHRVNLVTKTYGCSSLNLIEALIHKINLEHLKDENPTSKKHFKNLHDWIVDNKNQLI